MTSPECIEAMKAALKEIDAKRIEGDIVECGVWKGGNIILARALSPKRICWAYDTFSGMTAPDEIDGAWAKQKFAIRSQPGHKSRKSHIDGKWLAIPVDHVRDNIHAFGLLDETKIRFVRGPVETTLLDAGNLPDKIALLRLDTDWYESTKVELEVLYPRLSPCGVLIIDDYGHWQGSRIATDEYFAGQDIAFETIDEKMYSVMMRKAC